MGVRGLSSYINEHLHETLVRHKLRQRKVIIDGNNLAHVLYYECTGINASFGGDYDKYASFIEKFFRGLEQCEVQPIVVMDGGQPLDNKKMKTVRERVTNQIQTCLNISPNSQFRLKVFPCMGRDVFVSTLKKMGIIVLQTDFEADIEIAMLAKELGLTVLSNDSDFYVFDVPFILLSSITCNKVTTGKEKGSKDLFSYISCYHFNREKFCQVTGIAPTQFPILATLLGNDYISLDHFIDFYNALGTNTKNSRINFRHKVIKNVLAWLSRQKDKTTEEIIPLVTSHCTNKNLRNKMRAAMKNYTDCHSNLINIISENTLKYELNSTKLATSNFRMETLKEKEYFNAKNPDLNEAMNVETSLFCKNGKKLPNWFVLAYRTHAVPHEVVDILTQNYFISPPQVEEKASDSAYLLVEPIVKIVYTMLWKSSQISHSNYDDSAAVKDRGSDEYLLKPKLNQTSEWNHLSDEEEMHDSDVVIEESSEENLEDEIEKNGETWNNNSNENICKINEIGVGNSCDSRAEAPCHSRKEYLKWYLRKRNRLWVKYISLVPSEQADTLPSLSEVESMSFSEKRVVFYSILKSNLQSSFSDLPKDLELILSFIIFWYQESSSSLTDIHVLSVLVCMFMFYIIDGTVGKIRTRKAFEDEEKWKKQFTIIKSDASYCNAGASVKDMLAQMSQEECMLAGHRLFKFHHMNQSINDNYYNRKTVHAFSEYQACVYFMQLLNSLLGSPFPFLSIEYLWGGTFCYNVFYDLKKRNNPLVRVSEILGIGSCLEKLFFIFFEQLAEILNLKNYLVTTNLENNTGQELVQKHQDDNVANVSVLNTTIQNISKKKKKRKRKKSNKVSCDKPEGSEKEFSQGKEEGSNEEEEEVDLLDNRFSGLLVETVCME